MGKIDLAAHVFFQKHKECYAELFNRFVFQNPYLMRKVYSSEMDDFMPIQYVSQLDGHKNINTTNRYYIAKKRKKLKKFVANAELNSQENERFVSPDALIGIMNDGEDDEE